MLGPIRSKSRSPHNADSEPDVDYQEKRKRNNTAVKRSREKAREKNANMRMRVEKLKTANDNLEVECVQLEQHLNNLKEIFIEQAGSSRIGLSEAELDNYLDEVPDREASSIIEEIVRRADQTTQN